MLNSRTTFIVGAGASAEARLPLGGTLLQIVANNLNFDFDAGGQTSGDRELWGAFQRGFPRDNEVLESIVKAGRTIASSSVFATSIDRLIDSFHNDPYVGKCGKAAITQAIQQKENSSRLAIHPDKPRELRVGEISKTWYLPFAQALFDRVRADAIEEVFEDVSIVCFNYDRCIEHFLTFALSQRFRVSLEEARQLVNEKLKIYHPYGTIGKLASTSPHIGLDFGKKLTGEGLLAASEGIKTFAEQENLDGYSEVKEAVQSAETLVFLGFGYLEDNLELLSGRPHDTNVGRIFATVQGISESGAADVISRLWNLIRASEMPSLAAASPGNYIKFVKDEGGCKELFDEFWMNLTSG